MKLNRREKVLCLIVGIAVLAMIGFNVIYNNLNSLSASIVDSSSLEETRRLLRSERNIFARQKTAGEALTAARTRFLDRADPESAKIKLLKEVETLTERVGLSVEQKNLLQLERDIIGVTLEGKAEPDKLIRFLHAAATARLALNVKRLQVHANVKTKDLRYQIILQLMLVEEKAGK